MNSHRPLIQEGNSLDHTSIEHQLTNGPTIFGLVSRGGVGTLLVPILGLRQTPTYLTTSHLSVLYLTLSYLLLPYYSCTKLLRGRCTLDSGGVDMPPHTVRTSRLSYARHRRMVPSNSRGSHPFMHPPYDGYSMTHHHCHYGLGRTESHRTDVRTGSLIPEWNSISVFHLYLD